MGFWLIFVCCFWIYQAYQDFDFHTDLFLWALTMLGRWLNTGDSAVSKIFVLVGFPQSRLWGEDLGAGGSCPCRTGGEAWGEKLLVRCGQRQLGHSVGLWDGAEHTSESSHKMINNEGYLSISSHSYSSVDTGCFWGSKLPDTSLGQSQKNPRISLRAT